LEFDIMLEAKAKDLALLRLRRDLACYAPDLSARFGSPCTYAEGEPDMEVSLQDMNVSPAVG
jgi:UV DNA damage endonuclease